MNTIIVIEQTCKTAHEIKIKGEISDSQMAKVASEVIANRRMAFCIDDIADIVSRLGFEVIDIDHDGEEISSDFEWLDDRQE